MRIFISGWQIAFRQKSCGSVFTDLITPFTLIPNTWRYQAADPFLVEHEGVTYIFAELLDKLMGKGILGYSKFENGHWVSWKPVIREKWHLSWPYLFERDGDIFIMPEAGAAKKMYFYKAAQFPDKWERLEPFASGHTFADPVCVNIDEKTYFFVYLMDTEPKSLWMAKVCEGYLDYSHYQNPVSTDDRIARPAGKFLRYNGDLIRVSQDCQIEYGQAVVFSQVNAELLECGLDENEILRINEKNIKLNCSRKINGVHTYNANQQFEVVDIKYTYYSLLNILGRLLSKIRSILGN